MARESREEVEDVRVRGGRGGTGGGSIVWPRLNADRDENLFAVQSDESLLARWRDSCDDNGITGSPLECRRDAIDCLLASCLAVDCPACLIVDGEYMIPLG